MPNCDDGWFKCPRIDRWELPTLAVTSEASTILESGDGYDAFFSDRQESGISKDFLFNFFQGRIVSLIFFPWQDQHR